ncbi:hypothetical protein BDB01DRAFT_721641 [Pilobolus umbonatus]|nr:hypothetical protein BDB01DRAFT_721641 [Pilobolus umbonatus]
MIITPTIEHRSLGEVVHHDNSPVNDLSLYETAPQSNQLKRPITTASFSLTNDKDSIKIFRRMAFKINNSQVQLTYAKYLMKLVYIYIDKINDNVDHTISDIRDRLQREAEYWIERLAKLNCNEALYIKAQWHRQYYKDDRIYRIFVGAQYKKVNHLRAFKYLQRAAKLHFTEAHYDLADYYIEKKDYKKAISCYQLAASDDHLLSLYKLGNIMLRGLFNQERNIGEGIAFLKRAASMNMPQSALSAYDLACIYANDLESIDLDSEALAITYFEIADRLCMTKASLRLAHIYEHGYLNCKPNPWKAYQLYMKASELGDEMAMLELSRLYRHGIANCLNAHPPTAFKWCYQAAESNNIVALYTLG